MISGFTFVSRNKSVCQVEELPNNMIQISNEFGKKYVFEKELIKKICEVIING